MAASRWACVLNGRFVGRKATRQAAMNLIDRPYQSGAGLIEHSGTGETWARRRGSWYRITRGRKRECAA